MEYAWSTDSNTRATQFLSRVLSRGELSHAYLFVGPRASEAKIIGGDFVGHLAGGKVIVINEGKNDKGEDVKGITVHQIRELLKSLFNGTFGTRQVVLIDPPQPLSSEASNALLKIMEEPPRDTIFVLYAERLESMLPTIVSRCQIIRCYEPIGPRVDQDSAGLDTTFREFLAMPFHLQLRALPEMDTEILDAVERWIDMAMDKAHTIDEYHRLMTLADAVVSSRRYLSSNLSQGVLLEPMVFALH